MFNDLNASTYIYKKVFYNAEFEDILSKVITCYNIMLKDNVSLTNDENSIRDILLINYLKNNSIRKAIDLTGYLFDREVPEDRTKGRTDIKVQTIDTFKDTSAYYTIECKRLDASNPAGGSGLNAKYIQNGICRFASKSYSTHYQTNGMIGFVVQTMDIHKNVEVINTLLKDSYMDANTTQVLVNRNIISGFDFSYCSTHNVGGKEITIYHLMFDFSKNILPN